MINNIFKRNLLIFMALIVSGCNLFISKVDKKIPPNYGNYCIFDHSIKNFNLIPLDKTDLACKNFHKCLKNSESNPKNCSNELISKLEENQKKSAIETRNYQKIIEFFKE